MFFEGPACKEVRWSVVNEPERWKLGEYVFRRDDGIQVWIGNGLSFYGLYPGEGFGLIGKIRFYFDFQWWKGWKVHTGRKKCGSENQSVG